MRTFSIYIILSYSDFFALKEKMYAASLFYLNIFLDKPAALRTLTAWVNGALYCGLKKKVNKHTSCSDEG